MARHFHGYFAFLMTLVAGAGLIAAGPAPEARAEVDAAQLKTLVDAVEGKVIDWRRDIHSHPELSNREFRTAKLVADHLRRLGLDTVETNIAHTGVIGTLIGALPGPTIALRADMDALPVAEPGGLPFASTTKASYNGQQVGVMHACGHDTHTAMLMGVAEVLAAMRDELPGTVKFIFQPAEEGAPVGEDGGAALMVREGVLAGDNPPEAIFGMHVWPGPAGEIRYRSGAAMAASDRFTIIVRGKQTHGSMPWRGKDPIIVAAQIMIGLQTIPARQLDITAAPAVVSVGSIQGGVRYNIIPDQVTMTGTIRTFDTAMRDDLHARIKRTAEKIAESAGLTAEVDIAGYAPVTFNDPKLTRAMLPSLYRAAGADQVKESPLIMGAEDFSYFQREVPGFYFFLGVNKPGVAAEDAAPNHSPFFYVNEDALIVGVRAMAGMAVDYLQSHPTAGGG